MHLTYPLTAVAVPTGTPVVRRAASAPPPTGTSSWRYEAARRSRTPLIVAIFTSAALHAGLLLGVRHESVVAPRPREETAIVVDLVMPEVKELAAPDLASEELIEVRFELMTAPRQLDVPRIALPTDFVQAMDFSSLIDRASLKAGEMVIPDVARQMAERVEVVFNLADLDRHPEVYFQPAVTYPPQLKRAGVMGRVLVEFVVEEDGRTRDPVVIESSDIGFEAAARNGILRWRFRPGVKDGVKVSARMRVPIEFRLVE